MKFMKKRTVLQVKTRHGFLLKTWFFKATGMFFVFYGNMEILFYGFLINVLIKISNFEKLKINIFEN